MSGLRRGRSYRRRASALALAAFVAALGAAPRARGEDPDRQRLDAEERLEAQWRARAQQLEEDVAIARERLAAAEKAYAEMRALNYPRGAGKRAVVRRVEDATQALAGAEEERARLQAAADAAGVPALWLELPPEPSR